MLSIFYSVCLVQLPLVSLLTFRAELLACGFTGAAGWMTFWILQTYCHQNIGISNFLGAMMIGLISIFFSRIMHMPVIVFNVPSLVPLVPGGPAYMAVRYMMNQEFTESMEKVVTVLVTAGAIAIGFMFTNLIERALKRTRSNFQLK